MPGFTVPLAIPYPLPTDPADGPAAIQAMAERVDDLYVQIAATASTIANPETCLVVGGTQPILDNTLTTLQYNAELFDNAGMADLVSNPFRVVTQSAGIFLVQATVAWAPNGNGLRQFDVYTSAIPPEVQWKAQSMAGTETGVTTTASFLVSSAANNSIFIRGRQTAGTTLDMTGCALFVCKVSS